MSPHTAVMELEDVTLAYTTPGRGSFLAVDHVSASFQRGSATAIVGRSGAGKSSLVSVLALLRTPTSGNVILEGESTAGLSNAQRAGLRTSIGMVFQGFHVDLKATVMDNVLMPRYFTATPPGRQARAHALELLDRIGIAH